MILGVELGGSRKGQMGNSRVPIRLRGGQIARRLRGFRTSSGFSRREARATCWTGRWQEPLVRCSVGAAFASSRASWTGHCPNRSCLRICRCARPPEAICSDCWLVARPCAPRRFWASAFAGVTGVLWPPMGRAGSLAHAGSRRIAGTSRSWEWTWSRHLGRRTCTTLTLGRSTAAWAFSQPCATSYSVGLRRRATSGFISMSEVTTHAGSGGRAIGLGRPEGSSTSGCAIESSSFGVDTRRRYHRSIKGEVSARCESRRAEEETRYRGAVLMGAER